MTVDVLGSPLKLRPILGSSVLEGAGYVALTPAFEQRAGIFMIDYRLEGVEVVRFRSGAVWAYLVPSWMVGMLHNPRISRGRFFSRHMKGKLPAMKLEQPRSQGRPQARCRPAGRGHRGGSHPQGGEGQLTKKRPRVVSSDRGHGQALGG